MPLFLIDPPMWFYYILIAIALTGFAVFGKNQTRKSLYTFLAAAAPLLALLVIDFSDESPREEVVRKVQAIARATREHKLDDAFRHVSDSFRYHGYDKASIKLQANAAYNGDIMGTPWPGATAWDFAREEFKQISDTAASQGFLVNMGTTGATMYCKVQFAKEADGQYRVVGFALYEPVKRDNDSEQILPGL